MSTNWTIDTAHTRVGFAVKHLMVSTVRGEFKTFAGSVKIDPKDFSKSVFEGEIDVASIDTNNKDRDNHLRTNDFFDAANHPKITFKSTKIELKDVGGNEYKVTGDITIRGITKPIAIDVEFHGVQKSPWGKYVAGLSATGTVNRHDFGVSFNAALETGGVVVGEKVKLELELEAIQAEATVAPQPSANA